MNLISNLLKKIFGDNKKQAESTVPKNNNYLVQWEKEREERIIAAEKKLKNWVITFLKERGDLHFSWESGNDEAFATFQDAPNTDKDNFEDLEFYIIDKLDIPDAGEFQMNGKGTIYLENDFARVKYSSIMKVTIDFNEETEEEIFGEEEHDSGDKVLFHV